MRKSRLVILTVFLTLFVAVIIPAIVASRLKAPAKGQTVRVEQVSRGELVEFVSAPGEIEPKKSVEISAKVSARIVELPYEEGDRVTAGDPNANPAVPPSVLVRLDSKDLESELLSARAMRAAQAAQIEVEKARIAAQQADLSGLKASLAQAQLDLQRQRGLLQSKDVSQAAFDESKVRVDELQAQYDSAQYSLEAARLNLEVLQHNLAAADARIDQAADALSYTTITTPIDGVITRIEAEVGELAMTGTMNNPGTVIMEVADLSQMLVVAQVDEADVARLEVGQDATVTIDAFGDREFEGTVYSIALSHDMTRTQTKYYRTEILLDTGGQRLPAGLTANVDIHTRKHTDVIKVPSQAVLAREIDALPLELRDKNPLIDSAKTYTTVVYRYIDGKAVATPVKTGRSDLTHTIIETGLSENDKIIVGPYKVLETLKHDQKVLDEREEKKPEDTDTKSGAGRAEDGNDV